MVSGWFPAAWGPVLYCVSVAKQQACTQQPTRVHDLLGYNKSVILGARIP